MNKQQWLVDISLIIIIIVMGVFVVIELNRTFDFMRQRSGATSQPSPGMPDQVDSSAAIVKTDGKQPVKLTEDEFNLLSLDGEYVVLSNYEGYPVMVNFWATWCPPCLAEMPLIQEYAQQHASNLVVLAINAGEEEGVVRDFIAQHGFDLQVLLDPTNSAAKQYHVYGFPTSLFFDQDGDLEARHIGELDEGLLTNYLAKIGIGE